MTSWLASSFGWFGGNQYRLDMQQEGGGTVPPLVPSTTLFSSVCLVTLPPSPLISDSQFSHHNLGRVASWYHGFLKNQC